MDQQVKCLPNMPCWHKAGLQAQLYSFLTLVPDEGGWSMPYPSCLCPPGKEPQHPLHGPTRLPLNTTCSVTHTIFTQMQDDPSNETSAHRKHILLLISYT
jgi:hypothetical protein